MQTHLQTFALHEQTQCRKGARRSARLATTYQTPPPGQSAQKEERLQCCQIVVVVDVFVVVRDVMRDCELGDSRWFGE